MKDSVATPIKIVKIFHARQHYGFVGGGEALVVHSFS